MAEEQQVNFLGSLDARWDEYRKQFKAARGGLAEEVVHDLRVAARRFLAFLDILRSLDAHPRARKIRRFLKRQLNQLDELRDAQVMSQETAQGSEGLPDLNDFHDFVELRAGQFAQKARKKVRAAKPSDLKMRVKKLRKVAERHSEDPELLAELEAAVDGAHARTMQAFGRLSTDDPATVHTVRIAFRRFRYMVETVGPLLPGYPIADIDRMHEYQELMGKVHDTSILLDTLHEFEQQLMEAPGWDTNAIDLAPAKQYYRQRLKELIQQYFDRKGEISTFWRAAPDKAFPWENSNEPVHRTARDRRAAAGGQQRGGRQSAATHSSGT